jgi:ABC-type multidrug transport system fused ATPase/permease subunit
VNLVSAHVRNRRLALWLTYALVVVENTFELLYPFAIGLAVDDLLDDSWRGVVVFASITLSHTAVSFGRQRYDARSFARLYADVASDLVEHQRADGVSTTAIVGRTNLAGEYVEFLENDVPLAITSAFAVVGSLVMLFLYDPIIGLAGAAVAVPVALLNRRLVRRSRGVYQRLNDQTEAEVAVIEQGDRHEVRRHFGIVGRQWIRLSDQEATSWGAVEVIAAGLAVFTLVRATRSGAEPGAIFATIAYLWAYIGGFDQVPGVLQRMASLADIKRRLDALDDDSDGPQD